MVAFSYILEVAEPGQLDPRYRARSCPSVDLSVLGSPATVADLKENILLSIGCPAAFEIWGPSISRVADDLCLHYHGRRCTDMFYLLAGQLYMQAPVTSLLGAGAQLPPIADLSKLAGEPLLRVKAVKQHPAAMDGQAPRFDIHVKTLTGKILNFNVSSTSLVEELKEMVQNTYGPPPNQQRLIFSGEQLEDGRTLSDYCIDRVAEQLVAEGSSKVPTLHMVMRLRGGMWHQTSGRHDNVDMSHLPHNHTEVTVAVPGLGELQLTVPADVTGPELLLLVQRQAEAATAERDSQWPLLPQQDTSPNAKEQRAVVTWGSAMSCWQQHSSATGVTTFTCG